MKFYYPLQSGVYTGNSPEDDPGAHNNSQNYSLDLATPVGTQVYAITDGTVVICRATDEYDEFKEGNTGKCVSIKFSIIGRSEPLYATYMHLSRVDVKLGQEVKMGQQLGLSGNTGYSFGPHLHIQISSGEWSSDPILTGEASGEQYRFTHPEKMSLVEKLFRYLKVSYDTGNQTYKEWIWSGDSRTVSLGNDCGVATVASSVGAGYNYLNEHKDEIKAVKGKNILLWWGINDLSNYKKIADVYNEIAVSVRGTSRVYVATVGHCPNGSGSGVVDGGSGQSLDTFNKDIVSFNKEIKKLLSEDITIIDLYEEIKELEDENGASWLSTDNLHYTKNANEAILDIVQKSVSSGIVNEVVENDASDILFNYLITHTDVTRVTKLEAIIGMMGTMYVESCGLDPFVQNSLGYFSLWQTGEEPSRTRIKQRFAENGLSKYIHIYNGGAWKNSWTKIGCTKDEYKLAMQIAIEELVNANYNANKSRQYPEELDVPMYQTGEHGAASYAELFDISVERDFGGEYTVEDPNVNSYSAEINGSYHYKGWQGMADKREAARNLWNKYVQD